MCFYDESGPTPELLTEYGQAMEHREDGLRQGGAKKLVKAAASKSRWGVGGARLVTVHVDQGSLDADAVDVQIAYEGSGELTSAVFRVGFIDESGRDLSIIRNQMSGPVSLFTYGTREGFVGVYHPHTSTGTVHLASPSELPTHKVWSWGADAEALPELPT